MMRRKRAAPVRWPGIQQPSAAASLPRPQMLQRRSAPPAPDAPWRFPICQVRRAHAQRILRHELLGHLTCECPIDAASDVNLGKLFQFKRGCLAQFLAFARKVCLLGVGLRTDGDILAGSHRHRTSHQSGNTGNQHIALGCGRRGDTDDQACRLDDTVFSAEHRGAQPTDAADEVIFLMLAQASHKIQLTGQTRCNGAEALSASSAP
jgi:hypothetical protein